MKYAYCDCCEQAMAVNQFYRDTDLHAEYVTCKTCSGKYIQKTKVDKHGKLKKSGRTNLSNRYPNKSFNRSWADTRTPEQICSDAKFSHKKAAYKGDSKGIRESRSTGSSYKCDNVCGVPLPAGFDF